MSTSLITTGLHPQLRLGDISQPVAIQLFLRKRAGERRSNKLAEASGRGYSRKESGVVYLVKVHSPKEKGKANEEVVRLLAEFLGIKRSSIIIKKGEKSSLKTIQIKDN